MFHVATTNVSHSAKKHISLGIILEVIAAHDFFE